MKKPSSDKKIAASRVNGKKGTGPKDTRSTKFNALKHGLTAAGITELDNAEGYGEMLRELTNERKPAGVVDIYFLESIVLTIIRSRRVRRMEAEFITGVLNPPTRKGDLVDEWAGQFSGTIVDPGLPAPMPLGSVQTLFQLFHRYGTGTEQQLYRLLREQERLEEKRRDQPDPAPAKPEGTGHNHNRALISFTESTDTTVAPLSGSTEKLEEQQPLAAENEATGNPNIQVDAPDVASFADAPTDIQRLESAPPDESEELTSFDPGRGSRTPSG